MTDIPPPFQSWETCEPLEKDVELSEKAVLVGFGLILLVGMLTLTAQVITGEYFSLWTWLNVVFLCIIGYGFCERLAYLLT